MNAPPSRLLTRIEQRIASALTQRESDCARGERACYMARQGNFAEANIAIQNLRSKYSDCPDVEVIIWINLAEGLVTYYRELGPLARDKILRAHALSVAAEDNYLRALAAAWLAQMDFSALNVNSLARHANEALQLSKASDHAVRFRVGIVIAQSLHLSGRWDLAAPWYSDSRIHATLEGDTVSVSSLMHNMVSMRLDHFRQVVLTGDGESSGAAYALVGIESSESFDHLIGISTLEELRPIMRARFLSLQGRYAQALAIYDNQVLPKLLSSLSRLESDVMSDVAWCRLKQGNTGEARRARVAAENGLDRCTQVDDRAATHTRLSSVCDGLGDYPASASHKVLATALWQEFRELQDRLINGLGSLRPSDYQ
jgi:hypothetical protein